MLPEKYPHILQISSYFLLNNLYFYVTIITAFSLPWTLVIKRMHALIIFGRIICEIYYMLVKRMRL